MEDNVVIITLLHGISIYFEEEAAQVHVYELVKAGATPKISFKSKKEVMDFFSNGQKKEPKTDKLEETVNSQSKKTLSEKIKEGTSNRDKVLFALRLINSPEKALNLSVLRDKTKLNTNTLGEFLHRLHKQGAIKRTSESPYKYWIETIAPKGETKRPIPEPEKEHPLLSEFIPCAARDGKKILGSQCIPNAEHKACKKCENFV